MKKLIKFIRDFIPPIVVGGYIGCIIGGNVFFHYTNYRSALSELEKDIYGPNLKIKWLEYMQKERSAMRDLRILVPFSDRNERPLTVKYGGSGEPLIPIQFDIVKKRDNSI